MVRTVLANRRQEKYLEKCGAEHEFAFGLIIGQPTEQNKDYVVHLARNSEKDVEIGDISETDSHSSSTPPSASSAPGSLKSIADVDSQALLNQVISVTKMIPGCFYVLGLFIVSEKNLFDDEVSVRTAKKLIQQINSVIKQNKHFCGTSAAIGAEDKLLLAYSKASKSVVCKTFESKEGGGYFMPIDWKFLDKPTEWHKFESNYELDDVFPVIEKDRKVNIEHHFHKTLDTINSYIANSEIFIQNESVDEAQLLETYIKQKQHKKEPIDSFKANILLPAIASATDPIRIEKFNGTVRFSGIVSSRVWSHPKNSFKEIQTFIRHDILRSLAARIQIYCDGLTEPIAGNDPIVISEPPRRVFFDVPEGNGIQFSEYIFRGEAPTVAAAQAKEILDLDIDTEKIHADLEGLLDDDAFSITPQTSPTEVQETPSEKEISRTMYIVGIAIALLVLLVAILLHFVLR